LSSIYENIDHQKCYPARIFITQINESVFHWHYDYELLLVLKGSLQTYCGPVPSLLKAGDLNIFNSKTVHGFKRTADDNLCLFVQFSPQLFHGSLDDHQVYRFYLNSTSDKDAPKLPYTHFVALASQIGLASLQVRSSSEMRTHALLLTLAADLLDHTQYDIRRLPLEQEMDFSIDLSVKITEFIDRNLFSRTLSADLCKTLGMSEKTLYRYLKNTLGLTLKELLDTSRIKHSRQLLRGSSKPISVVADECGFISEVSFYRTFKRETGLTPNDYRKGGNTRPVGDDVQGYLSFDPGEAVRILLSLANPLSVPGF